MMIHDVTVLAGKYKDRKRVGRGEGSGHGKQSGRGNKGAGSRSGNAAKTAFEGGQMPYFRRLPKFGFTNAAFKTEFWIVNLRDIASHRDFAKGGSVSAETLIKAGLIRDTSRPVKVLGAVGDEGLKMKLDVVAARVSDKARQLIEAAGGKVNELGTSRDRARGVARNNVDDRAPKNLTKKLKRSGKSKGALAVAAAAKSAEGDKGTKPAKAEKAEAKAEGKPEGKLEGKKGKPAGPKAAE